MAIEKNNDHIKEKTSIEKKDGKREGRVVVICRGSWGFRKVKNGKTSSKRNTTKTGEEGRDRRLQTGTYLLDGGGGGGKIKNFGARYKDLNPRERKMLPRMTT